MFAYARVRCTASNNTRGKRRQARARRCKGSSMQQQQRVRLWTCTSTHIRAARWWQAVLPLSVQKPRVGSHIKKRALGVKMREIMAAPTRWCARRDARTPHARCAQRARESCGLIEASSGRATRLEEKGNATHGVPVAVDTARSAVFLQAQPVVLTKDFS